MALYRIDLPASLCFDITTDNEQKLQNAIVYPSTKEEEIDVNLLKE